MTTDKSIPVIDISAYLDPSSTPEAQEQVIDQVRSACSRYGFLQITGHGVPLSAQRAIIQCCKTFFALPLEQKEALSLKDSPSQHGYERLREQTLDPRALPDEKEGFYIGREEPYEKGFRRGPNRWPTQLVPADFREPVQAYYAHMERLARAVLEMLVRAWGHAATVLDALTHEPGMNLKLLHYPPAAAGTDRSGSEEADGTADGNAGKGLQKQRFGAGEHTDFGTLTLLLQQPGKHGLQVYDAADGAWIAVPAVEDVLVANMGDLVQKWTDGRYRSTLHRVVHAADDDRYSVPCFYEGNFSATNPFKPGVAGSETVEEHIMKRFNASYGFKASV